MTRDSLRRFLGSLVMSTLAGCCSNGSYDQPVTVDGGAEQLVDGGLVDGTPLSPEVCAARCPQHAGEVLTDCRTGSYPGPGWLSDEGDIVCTYEARSCNIGVIAGGQPPAGLRPMGPIDCADPVGGYFARMGHVEGAAAVGFARLAQELRELGAPASLCAAARAAALDERRHAKMARRLAQVYGAKVPEVEIDPTPSREAFALTLDNATDGGVFETFGATLTLWQSRAAGERRVRAAFTRIAADELRHAELAAMIARWIEPRLSTNERALVDEARRAAAARLAHEVAHPLPSRLVALAGLPSPTAACHLVTQMTQTLWS